MACLRPHSKEAVDLSSNPGLWMLKLMLLPTMLSYLSFPGYQIHPSGQVTWLYYVMLRVPAPIWTSVFLLWRKKRGFMESSSRWKDQWEDPSIESFRIFSEEIGCCRLIFYICLRKSVSLLTLSDTFYHAISCPSFLITIFIYLSLFKYFYN